MKRIIKSSTNSSNMMERSKYINAADDTEEPTLDDKINDAKDDFNYIIDGISQLDMIEGDDILNRLHESLQELIVDIASNITES